VTELRVGARNPEALKVTISPGNTGLNMTQVQSCALHVTKPDGSMTTWDTVLSGVTQYEVAAQHVFDVLGEEVDTPGAYIIEPFIMAPGSRRCRLFKVHVVPYPTP